MFDKNAKINIKKEKVEMLLKGIFLSPRKHSINKSTETFKRTDHLDSVSSDFSYTKYLHTNTEKASSDLNNSSS